MTGTWISLAPGPNLTVTTSPFGNLRPFPLRCTATVMADWLSFVAVRVTCPFRPQMSEAFTPVSRILLRTPLLSA